MSTLISKALSVCKRGVCDEIVAVREAMLKVSRGDLSVRISDSISADEFGELALAFDKMVEKLSADSLRLSRANEAQRSSESKYRELVEKANSIILKWDSNGNVSYFNEFAETFFGFSSSEIVGQSIIGTIVPETESSGRDLIEMMRSICNDPGAFINNVNENIRKNGERVWVSWNNHSLAGVDGKVEGILSVGQDVTERKRIEATLRESEEKYSAVFRASPDAVTLTRLCDGCFLEVNEAFTVLSGYSSEEVIGTSGNDLEVWANPEQHLLFLQALENYTFVKDMVVNFRRKDRAVVVGQVSARIIEINGEPYILGITHDITERELIQKELLKVQKLESITVLASGIAHNFNNVLTGVIGYISYAKKHLGNPEKVLSLLDSAEKSSYRAADLARQLLTFSKGGIPVIKPTPVAALIKESMALFLTGTNVRENIDCGTHHSVKVDCQQIRQAFNNIILNAVQAMPEGGTLNVRVTAAQLDVANCYSLSAGDYVAIVFEDSGCGVQRENINKTFDPYFTTKPSGTGLGLSTTLSIIRKHNGHIDIMSEVGKGTVVTILLPSSHVDSGSNVDGGVFCTK